jgi:hypothetical protein
MSSAKVPAGRMTARVAPSSIAIPAPCPWSVLILKRIRIHLLDITHVAKMDGQHHRAVPVFLSPRKAGSPCQAVSILSTMRGLLFERERVVRGQNAGKPSIRRLKKLPCSIL